MHDDAAGFVWTRGLKRRKSEYNAREGGKQYPPEYERWVRVMQEMRSAELTPVRAAAGEEIDSYRLASVDGWALSIGSSPAADSRPAGSGPRA
jgi:hypothetical protein